MVTPATFSVSETTCTSHHTDGISIGEMRIVGKNRPARRGARSVNHPAVAHRLRVRRQPLEARADIHRTLCSSRSCCPLLCRARSRIDGAPTPASAGTVRAPRGPISCDERIPQQLGPVVLAEPPREQLADRERIDRRPRLGRQAKQLMLERQLAATRTDIAAFTPAAKALERRSDVRRRARPLALGR